MPSPVTGCSLSDGSKVVTTTEDFLVAGVTTGMGVVNADVPDGATVAYVEATLLVLSIEATGTASGESLTFTAAAPISDLRLGPAIAWISAADVLSVRSVITIPTDLATEMALVASELLYMASGQQFTGVTGPVKVRPVARPTDLDQRRSIMRFGGFTGSWGLALSGMHAEGSTTPYGSNSAPVVDLGAYPVIEPSLVVYIDGELIPADEYMLDSDERSLIRVRTSAEATPTDRWGWPTSQILDLPDTEPGTFSVSYLYGIAPPVSGVRAAKRLAYELAASEMGEESNLPLRTTSTSSQGVTVQMGDLAALLAQNRTGLPIVDFFLREYNPSGAVVPSEVWTPDIGRPHRVPR